MDLVAISTRATCKRAALLFDHVVLCGYGFPEDHKELPAFVDYVSDPRIQVDFPGFADEYVGIYKKTGYHRGSLIPVYPSQQQFDHDFPTGQAIGRIAAIKNLPVIVEEKASWEQIQEFRCDKKALKKYRDFRYWLQDGLNARSLQEAEDLIGRKIEAYQWAIKEHGLKTITGFVSVLLHLKTVTPVAAGAGIGQALGGPLWSAFAGGLILSSEILVYAADRLIQLEDIKRGDNAEIAILYETIRRFGS